MPQVLFQLTFCSKTGGQKRAPPDGRVLPLRMAAYYYYYYYYRDSGNVSSGRFGFDPCEQRPEWIVEVGMSSDRNELPGRCGTSSG